MLIEAAPGLRTKGDVFFASAGTLPKAQATLYKGEGVLLEEHVAWHTRVMKGDVLFANTGF